MIVKNVVSQGYPFLEAIEAALPLCDEFLVSEGYSYDETWPVLQALQKKHPGKLKLFRDSWNTDINTGPILAKMTNILKQRCQGDFCLNVQANEILHELSLDELKYLPVQYPSAEVFLLPFYNIMGSRLLWIVDYRRRLFRNRKYIVSRGDAYDVGYNIRHLLMHPLMFYRHIMHGSRGAICYLSEPVYRYRALFPENYLAKLKSLRSSTYLWDKEYRFAQSVEDETLHSRRKPEEFWNKMKSFFDGSIFEDLPPDIHVSPIIPHRCFGELEKAPKIVGHLLNKWRYNLKDSIEALQIYYP